MYASIEVSNSFFSSLMKAQNRNICLGVISFIRLPIMVTFWNFEKSSTRIKKKHIFRCSRVRRVTTRIDPNVFAVLIAYMFLPYLTYPTSLKYILPSFTGIRPSTPSPFFALIFSSLTTLHHPLTPHPTTSLTRWAFQSFFSDLSHWLSLFKISFKFLIRFSF